jgi:biotin carboxylase
LPQIVLMGYRPAAVMAARRLGLDARVVVFAGGGEDPVTSSFPVLELVDGDRESLELLAERIGDADRVVALTESMVVPAARLRALLGIPGTSPAVALRGHDKLFMKEAFLARRLPCAGFLPVGSADDVDAIVELLGLPVIIKDRTGSGSRGSTVAHDPVTVRAALRDYGLAESLVRGDEMSVEAFVVGGEVIFESATQYLAPFWANVVPAPIDASLRATLSRTLRDVIPAIGLRTGLIHLEVFVSPEGVMVSEVALRPPGGHLMRLLDAAYDFNPWEALLRIELGERPDLPREPKQLAGVWILHPGAGTVEAVEGLAEVERMPSVKRVHCAARRGTVIAPRTGSGQAVGSVVCVGASYDALVRDLERAKGLVRFRIDGERRAADSAPFPMAEAKHRLRREPMVPA